MGISDKQHHLAAEGISFLNGFLRHPQQVGSIIPSSRYLEKHIIDLADIRSARTVIELGPGTGGTTRAFLSSMSPTARLLVIEINPDFVSLLNKLEDLRLTIHHGNAHDLVEILAQYQMVPPDVIVSGIPFSTLPADVGQDIVTSIAQVLADEGRFLAYQFRDRVEQLAQCVLGPALVEFELRNIPPLHLYCWHKHPGRPISTNRSPVQYSKDNSQGSYKNTSV